MRKSTGTSFNEFFELVKVELRAVGTYKTAPEIWVDYFEADLEPFEAVLLEIELMNLLYKCKINPYWGY